MTRTELELLRGLLCEASLCILRQRARQADEAVTDALRRVNNELDARRALGSVRRRSRRARTAA